MTSMCPQVPDGPSEKYSPSFDLLQWMGDNFKRYGDIYRALVYGAYVYVINNPRYADHVLRANWQNYRKGQAARRIGFLLGNGLMVSEGAFWKQQRQMIQPAFHDQAIGALTCIIRAANDALLERWEQAAREVRSVNVTGDISRMVLDITLLAIFGDDAGRVAPHFSVVSDESARDLQFVRAFTPLRKLIVEIASERRKQNRIAADMLGMLMEARDRHSGQPMPDPQLAWEILTLIVAGHETTASTLNWAWYLLSQHPEAEEKLTRELNALLSNGFPALADLPGFVYTRRVIEETLRLYPAGWLMTRKALKDDRLGDYFVPAGTEIYISPYLIQRHPTLWESPDRFDPDRFECAPSQQRHTLTMLPFSAGPRKCIGENMARLEMQIHLITVAPRLRLHCADSDPVELDLGVNLRSKNDFIMTPEIKDVHSSRFDPGSADRVVSRVPCPSGTVEQSDGAGLQCVFRR